MKEVKNDAVRRNIELLILPTIKAIEVLQQEPADQCDSPRDVLEAVAFARLLALGLCVRG